MVKMWHHMKAWFKYSKKDYTLKLYWVVWTNKSCIFWLHKRNPGKSLAHPQSRSISPLWKTSFLSFFQCFHFKFSFILHSRFHSLFIKLREWVSHKKSLDLLYIFKIAQVNVLLAKIFHKLGLRTKWWYTELHVWVWSGKILPSSMSLTLAYICRRFCTLCISLSKMLSFWVLDQRYVRSERLATAGLEHTFFLQPET